MNDPDFVTLLEWFTDGFLAETPTQTNRRGVWRGYYDVRAHGSMSTPEDLYGGSRLGSPDQPVTFQRYINDHPRAISKGGAYARPFRAALAELHGRHKCNLVMRRHPDHDCESSPTMARFLFSLGMAQGDWVVTTLAWDIDPNYRKVYTWTALKRLEARYSSYPLSVSWITKSDSQRIAEETA